jgi:hypothetical protein
MVYHRRRRRQIGGSATSNLTLKDMLINAAAGVLNKQKRLIMGWCEKTKE